MTSIPTRERIYDHVLVVVRGQHSDRLGTVVDMGSVLSCDSTYEVRFWGEGGWTSQQRVDKQRIVRWPDDETDPLIIQADMQGAFR